MFISLDKIGFYNELANNAIFDKAQTQALIQYLDLTSLNSDDTPETIETLCQQAVTRHGNVAAVCIYPKFVKQAKALLENTDIKIATVCNFPSGNANQALVLREIENALADGANEIDMVIPHQSYVIGQVQPTTGLIKAAKQLCSDKACLKVILEVGGLFDLHKISQASTDALASGADFIKTSTGKVPNGATPAAAFVMLSAIKAGGGKAGFKAAGGVRSVKQAIGYVAIAKQLMGNEWVTPDHFRIGASSLLNEILAYLG